MYRNLATAFFATTSLSPALAANVDFDSDISKVLVFPHGAQVTRLASGDVPQGDHVVIVDDLPGNVIPDSIRVRGAAGGSLLQSSVDIRHKSLFTDDKPEERKRLEKAIEDLQFEQNGIKRKLADINLQRKLLQALATRAVSGGSNGENSGISAENLDGLLNSAGARLEKLQSDENDALIRQNAISKEIAELQIALGDLAPDNRIQTVVEINVSADAAVPAAFEIEYKVNQAGWQPVYDARLTIGDDVESSSLELLRRASVQQNTGESWDGIELSLSTARPSSATTAPSVHPYEIDVRPERPIPVPQAKRKLQNFSNDVGQLAVTQAESMADTVLAASEPEVVAKVAGFQAVFEIPGKTSVANTGETKSVTIDKYVYEKDLYALSAPRYDLSAFLMAGFEHDGDTPLIPGQISLSRDSVFIGRGHLPLLAPGKRHEMGFGVDDQIVVTRVETDKEKGESGFVSTVNTDRRVFKMTVTNQHDFNIPVQLRDRMPVSNQEDIVVEMTSGSTEPDTTDLDGHRGVLEWKKELSAGDKWEIEFGYEVSWPEEMKITRID